MALTNLVINGKILCFRLATTETGTQVEVTGSAALGESAWFDTLAARPECARSACIEGSASTHHERILKFPVETVTFDPTTNTVQFQVNGMVYRAHVMRSESANGPAWQVVFAHTPTTVKVTRDHTRTPVAEPAVTSAQQIRFVPAQAAAPAYSGPVLRSPLAGRVSRIVVEPGQRVELGQPILFIESMKMENEMGAPRAAFIKTIFIAPGNVVQPEQILVEFEEEGGSGNAATKDVNEPTPIQNR